MRRWLSLLGVVVVLASACSRSRPSAPASGERAAERNRMVDQQVVSRGVRDPRVQAAMRKVARHEFVPEAQRGRAYEDHPLAIGHDQTISQPYIVALMTELAALDPESRVLEIGTGSGYQAAVLAELAAEVYSIEIVEPLANEAAATLRRLGYRNVHVRHGDGYRGWPEAAPFDAILVTAAPPEIPEPLKQQVKVGGRLVLPVGGEEQELVVVHRVGEDEWQTTSVLPVVFVPMTGEAAKQKD